MAFKKREGDKNGGLCVELALDEYINLVVGDYVCRVIFTNISGQRIKLQLQAPKEVYIDRSSRFGAREKGEATDGKEV